VFVNNSRVQQATFVNATTLQAVIPAVLLVGSTPVQLSVRNPDAVSSAFTVPVGTAAPTVDAANIVNAATALPGSVSPGQLVAISGRNLGPDTSVSAVADGQGTIGSTLGETRVLFDGAPAPLLSVSSNQVNAVVPSSVGAKTSVMVEVEYRGQRSPAVAVGVGPASPGIFTANSAGTGQAAALNENFSPNSAANPAAAGSLIVLYATGFGLSNPAAVDGRVTPAGLTPLPSPVLPVRVEVNGVPAEVIFVGSAVGLVPSVVQLNVRLPASVTAGDAVPILLTVGAAQSRTGVTIAIR
jgi:uncharacterized protein (TIGR03437 family)